MRVHLARATIAEGRFRFAAPGPGHPGARPDAQAPSRPSRGTAAATAAAMAALSARRRSPAPGGEAGARRRLRGAAKRTRAVRVPPRHTPTGRDRADPAARARRRAAGASAWHDDLDRGSSAVCAAPAGWPPASKLTRTAAGIGRRNGGRRACECTSVVGLIYAALLAWTQAAPDRGTVSLPLDVRVDETTVLAPDVLWFARAIDLGAPRAGQRATVSISRKAPTSPSHRRSTNATCSGCSL